MKSCADKHSNAASAIQAEVADFIPSSSVVHVSMKDRKNY